jgi:hypothetical protein
MNKYSVTLSQIVSEQAVIEVEADNEQEAECKAIELATTEGSSVKFEFEDVFQEMEAIETKELRQ